MFYAVIPTETAKQFYLFRNRAHIFRRYGEWGWTAADAIRYGHYVLVCRRLDAHGFAGWARTTRAGWSGGFMQERGPRH